MTSKRTPFIEGFRQPTLSKNSFLTLADVRGDGEGKLVIWSEEQSQLIIYKGSNRELEKPIKLKNVSGIIHYQDQQRNSQSVIAMTAQNGFYIFRGLTESFRLRIPDIFAEPEEQMIWTQYESNPQMLGSELQKIDQSLLSETAKYYLGSNSVERKRQLIKMVFEQGINQKDSISSVALLKQSDLNHMGNIILGTELNRLYILDNYGHSIIHKRIVPFTPSILLGYGNATEKYVILVIGREGEICLYTNKDQNEPIERVRNNTRVVSACMSYPDIILVGADQTVNHHLLSNSTFKFATKKYCIKLNQQPIKAQFLKFKGQKLTIVAFENQVRFYNQKELNYTFVTDYKLYNVIWGSFAREQCCLILLYEQSGFEVMILHRQFNIKEKYPSNKSIKLQYDNIPIPKKSNHFLTYWNDQEDQSILYKHFQRGLKLLKWRTLRQKFEESPAKSHNQIQINTKVLGLGPIFNIILQIQNISDDVIFNIGLVFNIENSKLEILKKENRILMLAPSSPVEVELTVRSLSCKNQTIELELMHDQYMVNSLIHIPNCEQFGDLIQ